MPKFYVSNSALGLLPIAVAFTAGALAASRPSPLNSA